MQLAFRPHPRLRPSLLKRRGRVSTTGFSLIEVMVSIVILVFGLLGAVGMQAAALQSNRDSRLQSVAVRLAREASELMRGNRDVSTKTTPADNPYLVDFSGTLPAAPENCLTATCSSAVVAARFELRDWLRRASEELPGAKVRICYDEAAFNSAGLPVWPCSNSGSVAVVKVGWTRASTDRSAQGAAAFDLASAGPAVVMPVASGTTP